MLLGSQALVNDPYYNNTVLLLRGYDATSGQTFKDYSKYNRTITANGNVAHSTTQKKYGNSSIYFDGNFDYLSIASSSDFSFGNNDFSIECWLLTNGYSGSQYGRGFITLFQSSNHENRLLLRSDFTSNKLNAYLALNGSTKFGVAGTTSTNALTVSTWNFISFIRESNNFKLYINGNLEFTITGINDSLSLLDYVVVGRYEDGAVPDWNGNIEDVRITRRARDIIVPTQPFPNW